MLTLGALQFIVFLMVGLGSSISGILMAMDKFYLFNRMGIKSPCFFCIVFWTSLCVAIYLMWNNAPWFAIPTAFGSASIGRSLMTVVR